MLSGEVNKTRAPAVVMMGTHKNGVRAVEKDNHVIFYNGVYWYVFVKQ
jgi:hypothetical protein